MAGRLAVAAAAVALVGLLGACSGGGSDSAGSTTPQVATLSHSAQR